MTRPYPPSESRAQGIGTLFSLGVLVLGLLGLGLMLALVAVEWWQGVMA